MTGSFVKDVLFLGIGKIDDYYELYAAIMPFINEIFNLFSITVFKPRFGLNLYPHSPHGMGQIIFKSLVDMLAITGIAANAAEYGNNYARSIGLIKGSLYAFFTFFVPNVFMEGLLGVYKSNLMKFIIGILFIYILDVCVHGISYFYIKYNEEAIARAENEEKKEL